MKTQHRIGVFCAMIFACCLVLAPPAVLAQVPVPSMPAADGDPAAQGYGGYGEAASPNPAPFNPADDGSSFAIPIPGGGDVQVNGPPSEPPQWRPPIENWATQRNTPYSVGGAPNGPLAPPP